MLYKEFALKDRVRITFERIALCNKRGRFESFGEHSKQNQQRGNYDIERQSNHER